MARKKTRKKEKDKPNPYATGFVFIHIPDLKWDDISACHRVRMVWKHLVAYPKIGDSIKLLHALRVCGSCLRRKDIQAHYKLRD